MCSCGSLQKGHVVDAFNTIDTKYSQSGDQKLVDDEQLKNSLEKAEIRLEELVTEAKKAGSGAVTFLSSDLFIKANDASIRGDNTTAALLFKYVHMLVPKDNWVKRKYAVELIRIGDLELSEKILAEIFQLEGLSSTVVTFCPFVLPSLFSFSFIPLLFYF